MQAAQMLSPEAWFSAERDRMQLTHKRQLRLCEEEGCEESVAWRPAQASPICPGPFHPVACLRHALELEIQHAQEDCAYTDQAPPKAPALALVPENPEEP